MDNIIPFFYFIRIFFNYKKPVNVDDFVNLERSLIGL